MEKFKIDDGKDLELYTNFAGRVKDTFAAMIESIKNNIHEYEASIENTTSEMSDNEASRTKCEQEIEKMEKKIEGIKETIENVESTYKKMVDAYSSTSKGGTKELYSDIIDSAKKNCEEEVEKNRTEIARLNSDIEAIKNNIIEFNRIVESLNNDLENYNLELARYKKALEYMEKTTSKISLDMEDIAVKKEAPVKKDSPSKKADTKATAKKSSVKEEEPKRTNKKETPKVEEVVPEEETSFEDSLKQIYDMTGFTKDEPKEEVKEETPYTENLESLFSNNSEDIKEEKTNETASFLDNDISHWESILNEGIVEEEKSEEHSKNDEEFLDQLLTPYGTTYSKLNSLVSNKIVYKDGREIPFEMSIEDLTKAVNAVDGYDLKQMKTVGPEITLLRKVKDMKEGNL